MTEKPESQEFDVCRNGVVFEQSKSKDHGFGFSCNGFRNWRQVIKWISSPTQLFLEFWDERSNGKMQWVCWMICSSLVGRGGSYFVGAAWPQRELGKKPGQPRPMGEKVSFGMFWRDLGMFLLWAWCRHGGKMCTQNPKLLSYDLYMSK